MEISETERMLLAGRIKSKVDYNTILAGERVPITQDEILNLKIDLNTTKNVMDFFKTRSFGAPVELTSKEARKSACIQYSQGHYESEINGRI